MEEKICVIPEELLVLLVDSSSLVSSNWIFSNTLVIKPCDNVVDPGTITWRDVIITFHNMGSNKPSTVKRRMQVVAIPVLKPHIIISDIDVFNLLKSVVPACEIPYKDRNFEISFSEKSKRPLKASEVKICLVNNFTNITLDVIDAVLLNYFKRQRLLYKGDIFSVDLQKYLPELKFTKGYSNISIIYFRVCDIIGHQTDDVDNSLIGYLVDNTISLYQVSNQNDFVPAINHSIFKRNVMLPNENWTITDFLMPILPSHLQLYADKLKKYFQPFITCKSQDLQLKPLFLVSGPVGCGKTLLLTCTAKFLGLQYWRVECSGLISGPSGFNEAKLKSIFIKVKKHLPCLLQLNNLEALSEDREGNEDIRVVSCFNRLLTELKCDLPLLIVGTVRSVEQLSSELFQNILQVIDVENPSLNDRADAIQWLCPLAQTDALKIAARTSGFTMSDLSFLVSQTYREKYKLTCDENEQIEDELVFDDFLSVIDKMNAQTAGAIGAPQVPTVTWSDVGGHNEIKKEIVRSLNTANFGNGLHRSGILLWGPPGTGKTLLAKAVATECRSTFLSVKGPELLNMYVGQSEQNVRQVFQRAREAAPCIIFFDELDSLAPNRGKSDSAGVMDRVVSQLLSEMDGLQRNEGVFVLGATNRPDLIDPALLRPGRLDKMIYVGPCEGTEAKLSVLKALTRKFKMSDDVDLKQIAELLPLCLTGADLYSICYNAWQNAARAVIRLKQTPNPETTETVIVSADDFIAAVSGLTLGS